MGQPLDARGCALPPGDTDGDGVDDPNDDCPDTAAGTRADSRGCAIIFESGETSVVLDGVTFASGRATLTPDARTILDRVAESLVNAKDVSVEVQGYTDNTGSRETNVRLSGERAEAVRAYLITKGVPGTVMLPFEGRLNAEQITALAKYVRGLDTPAARKKKK